MGEWWKEERKFSLMNYYLFDFRYLEIVTKRRQGSLKAVGQRSLLTWMNWVRNGVFVH